MTDTDVSAPVRERLQRALAAAYWRRRFRYLDGPLTQEQWVNENWHAQAFSDDVDAILAELQEPSEGMVEVLNSPGYVHERWSAAFQHILEGGS